MADQPKGYVDATYLDLHKVLLDRAKRASYELLHLAPGHHVLDVGCGPATDTISLGRLLRQFSRQGLEDVKVRVGHLPLTSYALAREVLVLDRLEPQALAAGAFTRDQLARLHTSFEEADRAGYFFASVSGVTVAGRKS